MNNNCIFCKIVNGDIPSYKLYEDDLVIAFLDVNPGANGHTLIVPKKHYQDLYDIDDNTLNHIMSCTKNLSNMITSKLNANGFTLIQNNGDVQEVKHFHLHIKLYYNDSNDYSLEQVFEILSN